MNVADVWKSALTDAQKTVSDFVSNPDQLAKCARFTEILYDTFKSGGNLFTCGNGGSHCDAMHFAEEWTGRYRKDRAPVGALALGDASHTTCVSNDYGFEHVFERQIEGLGRKGDMLVVLSTSGNSQNLVSAVQAAKKKGIKTVGLLGRDGGKLLPLVDHAIVIPATTSDRIQEMHIKIIHTVIESVERRLFPENYK